MKKHNMRPWIRWAFYLPRPVRVMILITLAITLALPAATVVEVFLAVRGTVRATARFIKDAWRSA